MAGERRGGLWAAAAFVLFVLPRASPTLPGWFILQPSPRPSKVGIVVTGIILLDPDWLETTTGKLPPGGAGGGSFCYGVGQAGGTALA